jgi:hypothetical protein
MVCITSLYFHCYLFFIGVSDLKDINKFLAIVTNLSLLLLRFFMSSDRSRDSISHSRLAPSLNNKIGLHNLLVFRWAGKVQALTSSYYIGAQEIILVYDGTR